MIIEIILSIVGVNILGLGYTLFRRKKIIQKHKKTLFKKFKKSDLKKLKISPILKKKLLFTGAIFTDSLFDYFYNFSKIDPNMVDAIKRVHHGHGLDNMSDVIGWTQHNLLQDGIQDHEVNKYKGYLGEERHADYLRKQGHEVEMPDTSNQEGWDMKLDGQEINVKVTNNKSYINKHLEDHPNIPVHTGEELDLGDNVEGFDHLSNASLENATENSLDAIGDIGGVSNIPLITMGLSSFRNFKNKHKNMSEKIGHTVVDTGSVWVGFSAGGAIGTAILPGIGTVVCGAVGAMITKKGGNFYKKRYFRRSLKQLEEKTFYFIKKFYNKTFEFEDKLRTECEKSINQTKNKVSKRNKIIEFFNPTLMGIFVKESIKRTGEDTEKVISMYQRIRDKIDSFQSKEDREEESKREKMNYGISLSQSKQLLLKDRSLLATSQQISSLLQKVRLEAKKAS